MAIWKSKTGKNIDIKSMYNFTEDEVKYYEELLEEWKGANNE